MIGANRYEKKGKIKCIWLLQSETRLYKDNYIITFTVRKEANYEFHLIYHLDRRDIFKNTFWPRLHGTGEEFRQKEFCSAPNKGWFWNR